MSVIVNALKNIFGVPSEHQRHSLSYGDNIVFSSFGNDITNSDIVKTAIHRVAEEVSKCSLKHVVEAYDPHKFIVQKDDINAILSGRVNEFCAMKDFLYKVAYLTLVNENCYIYWAYDEIPIGNGLVKRVTRGLYPLENVDAKIYTTDESEIRIEFTPNSKNSNVIKLDLPYSDIIHIRHHYSENKVLGGDRRGKLNAKNLLENLQTVHTIKEAIPKAVKASLSLKGVLTMKTVADIDKKEVTRDEFEKHLYNSEYGIVATDYESDFTPVNISAQDIPSNVLAMIRDDILAPFGVSLPIYLGKYNDDEVTAFYQTAVEGLLIEIAQAFKVTLFTPQQIALGHTIKYYDRLVQSLSIERRIKIVEMTKEDALLGHDERRELLGYEPDGKETRVSLNYIDESIASEYQLKKKKNGEE